MTTESMTRLMLTKRAQYIAQMLLSINEKGTWQDPPPLDPTAFAKQDEEIFQTARLVKLVFLLFDTK